MFRWNRRTRAAGAARMWCVVGTLLGCQVVIGSRAEASQASEVADLASVLRSAEAETGGWRSAAGALLARVDDGEARAALQAALWDDRPAGVRRAVAEAVADLDGETPALVRSLGTALAASASERGSTGDATVIVRALGRHRSKEAVRALVENAVSADGVAREVRSAAMGELARLTGHREFASDSRACERWWGGAQWLSDADWASEVRVSPSAEAKPVASVGDRFAGLYRRLHAATAEPGRDALLVEMLESPEDAVRSAGFDLIMLALVNAKAVGEGPASAAAKCLADESPMIRAEAARTIELLERADDWGLLWSRLAVERDESAAAAMLRAGVRHPTKALVAPAIEWLESGSVEGARSAAAEALEASRRAGLLTDSREIDLVRGALRLGPVAEWSPAAFRLAVGVGMLKEVTSALVGADRATAKRAAAATAESAEGLEALVNAAGRWDGLFPEAAAGLRRFSATVDGYERLAALPSATADERAAALDGLTRAMPPAELVRLANSFSNVGRREGLLAPIVTQEFLAGTADLPERVELALVLARSRVMLSRPEDALATLALLPSDWQGPRALALRVTALVCMGRIGDADSAAPAALPPEEPPLPAEMLVEAWLQAVERCAGRDEAAGIVAEFEKRFGGALSVEQAARWRAAQRP